MTRLLLALPLVALLAAPTPAQQVTSPMLAEKAAAYMAEQVARLTNVVAEEHYLQQTTTPARKRTLKSDYLLIRLQDNSGFISFRDVFEVDGKAVRDRDERLQKLFLGPSFDNALEQAQTIARESARHNIWDIGTINNPYLAMALIQDVYRARFRLISPSQQRAMGLGVWSVQFQEFVRPTIIKGNGNADIPSRGLWWIDAASGRVLKTELRLGTNQLNGTRIEVTFRYDEELMLNLPAEMKEWYPDRAGEIRGVATYGRFRRFGVSTDEQLKP